MRASGIDTRLAAMEAAEWFDAHVERLNRLNVFPVPDGDTGTNMSLTLRAAAEALRDCPARASLPDFAQAASQAALLAARGNSGVILSQLLRGFAEAVRGEGPVSPYALAAGLSKACERAYASVSHPVEGTILTAARQAATAARTAAEAGRGLADVLGEAEQAAARAVEDSPHLNPVLGEAGVVDAGAEGYRLILEAARRIAAGESIEAPAVIESGPSAAARAHGEEAHGFCTELLLRACELSVPDVQAVAETLGGSVIVAGDEDLLRVHLHTERPGQALEWGVDHGFVLQVKVENMELQHDRLVLAASAGEPAADAPLGLVAVASGAGLHAVFRGLGAVVVDGGASMNPSVNDVLRAIQECRADQVAVLPNHRNVEMAARAAAARAGRQVHVLPTTNVAQGIAAAVARGYEASVDETLESMRAAAQRTHAVEVAWADRATLLNGVAVQPGQAVAFFDGHLVAAEPTLVEAARGALRQGDAAADVVTVYWGGDGHESANALTAMLTAELPAAEIEIVEGGQPQFILILSLES